MPYILLSVAILLGMAFGQSRIAFVGFLLVAVVFAGGRAFGGDIQNRGSSVVLLAAIYVPMLTAILRYLHEAGICTAKGGGRGILVLSSALMIVLLPEMDFFAAGISASDLSLLNPPPGLLRIPGIGLVAFGIAIPVLLVRREHENPRIGPAMAFCLLFLAAALNCRSSLWTGHQGWAAFLAFTSGAAVVLVWNMLVNSWHEAYVDELTELPGRRSMKQHFARLDQTYSVAILDIDRFKSINDKFGHSTGDQVLRSIASRLKEHHTGKPYRFGGEEFVIVVEDTPFEDVVAGLEELRSKIADRPFVVRSRNRPGKKPTQPRPRGNSDHAERITVTVSIGVAECTGHNHVPQDVLGAADKALYRAKEEGRNCVRAATH